MLDAAYVIVGAAFAALLASALRPADVLRVALAALLGGVISAVLVNTGGRNSRK